jgi:stage IV sporulation protein FB
MKISIHPLFFIFGIYFALTGKVFLFLNFTLTALIHEIGHSIAAERLGYKMNKITLMPYGTVVNGAIEGLSYKDEIKIAIYGPLFNLMICVVFTCLFWLIPEFYPYLESVVFSNLCIFTINLLPAYPLDGGRILNAVLCLKLNRKTSLAIVKGIGITISALLFALFAYSLFIGAPNPSILFFGGFILIGSLKKVKENAYVRAYFCQNGNSKRIQECKHLISSEGVLLKDLIAATNRDTLYTLEIKSSNGNIFLSQEETAALICSYRLYDNLGSICKDLFP